ncbi:toprim domain-containing protein [Streptomyces sp. NPDC050507]|uniref:toprim domain-containing protein n=1 Tax=Streptomyces sp. NPDC050507 TaxID=3365619 RepID=UPI00379739E4
MEEATRAYEAALPADEHARAFLRNRFLDRSEDSGRYFRLGVVHHPLPGHEQYAGMLAIPYLTLSGVVGMKFRCLKDHDCKAVHRDRYLNPPGNPHRLFNPTDIIERPEPYIAVCEGEMDAMTAHAAGLPAIGAPGASSFKSEWVRALRGRETVFVLADNDDGGTGLEKFAEPIAEKVPAAKIILMPEGHDANSFVQAFGYDALLEKVGVAGDEYH